MLYAYASIITSAGQCMTRLVLVVCMHVRFLCGLPFLCKNALFKLLSHSWEGKKLILGVSGASKVGKSVVSVWCMCVIGLGACLELP